MYLRLPAIGPPMLYKFLPTYPPSLESQIACGLRAQNHEKLPLASASTGNNHEHYCISRFDSNDRPVPYWGESRMEYAGNAAQNCVFREKNSRKPLGTCARFNIASQNCTSWSIIHPALGSLSTHASAKILPRASLRSPE
jgi:hypothetical protein